MRKKIILLLFISFSVGAVFSQSQPELPLNSCGIVNIYDAVGNRTKRIYFCNNGVDPYPTKAKKEQAAETMEYQAVDDLYPNPTTGKFSVTFGKPLANAYVFVADANGKIITQFKASGNKVDFDLSAVAAGVYFVRIEDGKNSVKKKVVKQ